MSISGEIVNITTIRTALWINANKIGELWTHPNVNKNSLWKHIVHPKKTQLQNKSLKMLIGDVMLNYIVIFPI